MNPSESLNALIERNFLPLEILHDKDGFWVSQTDYSAVVAILRQHQAELMGDAASTCAVGAASPAKFTDKLLWMTTPLDCMKDGIHADRQDGIKAPKVGKSSDAPVEGREYKMVSGWKVMRCCEGGFFDQEHDCRKQPPAQQSGDLACKLANILIERGCHEHKALEYAYAAIAAMPPFPRPHENGQGTDLSSEMRYNGPLLEWLKKHIDLPVKDEFCRGWNAAMQACLMFTEQPSTATSTGE